MQIHVHLSLQERMQIYELVQAGFSQAEIGRRLGRSKTTISRELRRNAVTAGYLPELAERRYQARRQRCRRRPRLENRSLRLTVIQLLERGRSPEQIAGRLRLEQGSTLVSHETLCRFVYESPLGRQEMLYHYLCRGQGRRERASPIAKGPSSKPGRWQHLSHPGRPLGDRFAALPRGEQALNVLVDRLSRSTVLTRLEGTAARDTRQVLVDRLSALPHRSLTAENGSGNPDHASVSEQLHLPFFFCQLYHSWEKGTVENTDGRIRRYLPRQTDLTRIAHTLPASCREVDLDAIADELNLGPRKCLGFRMPAEVLFGYSVALASGTHGHPPPRPAVID